MRPRRRVMQLQQQRENDAGLAPGRQRKDRVCPRKYLRDANRFLLHCGVTNYYSLLAVAVAAVAASDDSAPESDGYVTKMLGISPRS